MKNLSPTSLLQPYEEIILRSHDMDLPGHYDLEIVKNLQKHIIPAPISAKQAAVVLMIHASNGVPSILFIQRSDHIMQDKHRGQIAFPGGKVEDHESLKECAFREMEEEIGLKLPAHHPTRKLSPYYVSVSNFLIHPFVAFKDQLPNLQPNPEEVAAIIDSPLTDLEKRYVIHRKDFNIRGQTWKDVPYFQVADKTLWGATAIIFSEFLYLLKQHS